MMINNVNLKVVTWNANSIKHKLNEFKDFLYTNNYDVAGICETKIDNTFSLEIPGFSTYNCNRNSRGGGVAIAIKNNIKHSNLNVKIDSDIEAVGIKIATNVSELIILQVYIPPNVKLNYSKLNELFCHHNMIIMGDLNCRKREWNCVTDNYNGKILLNYCIDHNIEISAPLTNTNFPPRGSPSIIDIFLLKSKTKHSVPLTKNQLSSNHSPVEIKIYTDFDSTQKCKNYDFKKADWTNFKNEINNLINLKFYLNTKEQVENKVKELIKIITESANKHIPVKSENLHTSDLPIWLKAIIKLKNNIRRKSQLIPSYSNKQKYKSIVKLVQYEINKFHSKKLHQYLENLKTRNDSLWKALKK